MKFSLDISPNNCKTYSIMKNTEFIELTEMWHDGLYSQVGDVINNEKWSRAKVAEFCLYFNKYVGGRQFSVLYKFL